MLVAQLPYHRAVRVEAKLNLILLAWKKVEGCYATLWRSSSDRRIAKSQIADLKSDLSCTDIGEE